MIIPFNKPLFLGNEVDSIREAIRNGHLSGNGPFTEKITVFLNEQWGFKNVLLTNSCTSALEISGLLCDFKEGDEVILPSFTHVGTANAFERTGAKLVFADCMQDHPNIDPEEIRRLISPKTKAIVVVHYAGVGCDMESIVQLAIQNNCLLIEDAAHCAESFYNSKRLGSYGDLSTFSFHETKNIHCGHGGMLVINNPNLAERASNILNCGTNREQFRSKSSDYYTWVDLGSSYAMPELNASYLYPAVLECGKIKTKRLESWNRYYGTLKGASEHYHFRVPEQMKNMDHNGHIFYIKAENKDLRDLVLKNLNNNGVNAVFHYIPLHSSPYFRDKYIGQELVNTQMISDCIIRLPLYFDLSKHDIELICRKVIISFEECLSLLIDSWRST